MTASEKSFVGLAKQNYKSDHVSFTDPTDAAYKYLLFTDGSIAPSNLFIPLDKEVGGGAVMRSVIKAGVSTAGGFTIVPRPTILGDFLLSVIGDQNPDAPVIQGATTAYKHTFKLLSTDEFFAPYYAVRSMPGSMWGEQFYDVRVQSLALNWRAADYIRGAVGLIGRTPIPNKTTTTWSPQTYVDGGPQFLAPVTDIQLPTGTDVKVLSGSMVFSCDIPMDEQFITGAYEPEDVDINGRMFSLTLGVKVTDKVLYNKMNYDPADGAAWATEIFREADLKLLFNSDQEAGDAYPYSLQISANGQSGSVANVAWSVQPIVLRAGRQVTMAVTGTFLANTETGEDTIVVDLINKKSTAY